MERLTKVLDNGRIVTTEAEDLSYGETVDGFFMNYFTGDAIKKLALYEDTGYEPDEIAEIAANSAAKDVIINRLERKMEAKESLIELLQKKIARLEAANGATDTEKY